MNRMDILRARLYSIINYRLQSLAAHRMKNIVKPTFLCFKLTERCNSRCVHCDMWKQATIPEEDELSTSEWKRTLSEIRRWTGPAMVVFTGGEIFLRPDALEIIRHAASIGLVVEVLTNGILTDRSCCEQLIQAGPYQITLSLDGVSPETHERIRRVKGMHENIVRTADNLAEFRQKYNTPVRILFKMVMMQPNLHEVTAMADWVHEKGQGELMVQPIEQNYGQEEDLEWYKKSGLWIDDTDGVREVIHSLIEKKRQGLPVFNSEQHLLSMIDYFERPEEEMRRVQKHIATQKKPVCLTGVSSFVVSSNGDVRWCFAMPPAGNVKEDTPRRIWRRRAACWKTGCGYFL